MKEEKWILYSLVFQLKSPLHIGYHKIMHLTRTRLYVPARTLWGAMTVKLVQKTGRNDYKKAGQFLREKMRFGYFYFSNGKELFLPHYTEEGLKLGRMCLYEFEKKYIRSISTTAIDANSLSAEEETLHHLEYINYRNTEDSSPLFLEGLMWIKIDGHPKEDDFLFTYEDVQVKLSELLQSLQIGGERKYGFGETELVKLERLDDTDLRSKGFCGSWLESDESVKVKILQGDFIWAHAKYEPNLNMKGEIEIFMGREWDDKKGSGRNIVTYGLCWVPGSIVEEQATFEITPSGIWEVYK